MRAPPGSASNSRLSLQHIFAVLIGTAALLLLLNATYLTSLSPVGDLDVDLDGIVSARDIRRHAAATSPPHTSTAACDPHAAGTIRQRAAPPFNPIANASSVIRVGETVRLTVLTARTLRIEQRRNPRERFDERSSFAIVNRYLPVPSHKATLSSDCQLLSAHRCLVLTTAQLRLELSAPANATAAQITRGAAGLVADWPAPRLSSATLRVRLALDGDRSSEWHPGLPNPDQLPGTVRTLDKVDGATELRCDRLPVDQRSGRENDAHCAMGVISRSGWALLDDSLSARFDGAAAQWDWVAARDPERLEASGEALLRLDWYLFAAGLDYASALRDFAALSGDQDPSPWHVPQAAGLLREFEARGVPADVLVTDMDWHHTCYRRTYGNESEKSMDASHNWPCWSGFSFDKKYFPDPPAFLGWCKAAGVHNGLNLHFQSGLVKAEEDADRLPPDAEYAAFDPLNRTYSSHFHTHVLAPLERLGVDFWWLDWQQGEARGEVGRDAERWGEVGRGEHFFGGSETPEVNPTFWLNYVYSTQPDGRATPASAQRRRLIMHRWGGLGNQRYPIGFSGDTKSTWESLAFQPGFTASAANVAFGYWSHDIGGFFDRVEPELYVRWVQLGSLSPVFRAHGFRDPLHERRFWLFDEAAFVAMRSALRLRAELVPHLYTAARAAYDGGPSPVRPLYHEWPGLQPAYDFGGEYLFGAGQSLAVAHLTRRSSSGLSWSPLGAVPPGLWALDEIPILAKGGAVVFGQPPVESEWEHCGAGTRGWVGRAQHQPRGGAAETAVMFADPPTVERRRRAGERSSPLWYFDAELLCVVVWLFDLPAGTSAELTLRFDDERAARLAATVLAPLLSPRDDPAAAASAGALVLDYSHTTWLAGLGSRLASRPANFTNEMAALPATLEAARGQLRGECARRVGAGSGGAERVRNATALVMETGANAASFRGAKMVKADLQGADLTVLTLITKAKGVSFDRANLEGTSITDSPPSSRRTCATSAWRLSGSYWQGVQTRGMAFVDSWLTNAFLVGVNFDGVNMNGPCRLQGADLGYARFTNAMLQELQLEGAKATGASFENSKMNVADFTRALLDGASFRQTILTDATFHAADINECDFTSAVGVDKASFFNVIGTPIGLVG
ncbi:hypothetical protein EMIHUDRAFT_112277 [Emiliania huxleyi CCMP1516]|uniref:Glycoside hydrolase family 31 TIM barrel domain-containing protein n=2 Tax=Emiliania huxleyi TaxID=2903 RepID=A0A0D3K9Y7_EMIH1|nr:hypothetical protein EMIHUDRAFT_112277 [Emiliania huxleyi CCMP1516]EOD32572.1 hypothetical protein EMIHUDRAFT_112277 [Emiliania huxleyi CCMP1516]|eukprot:XP_005785001.1 hypothetical protein EMIHUDRAFT_112277 [Emiliania huxleyi CCMP1516]